MADPESSDVLANLPSGRPARRSSHRSTPGATAASAGAAKSAGTTAKPAAEATAAKPAAAKPKSSAKPRTTAKRASTATAKTSPAKATAAAKPAATAKSAPAKATAKPKAAAKPKTTAAKKPAVAKPTASAAKPAAAKAPAAEPAAPARRPRIATPTEGRRADFSGTPATHRARKVTTNRPWLPSSGYSLPDSKDRPPLGVALEGLAGALGDVARVSIGIVQSLSARRRGEIEATPPTESEQPEPSKS